MAAYDPEPLRRARADDKFMEEMETYLQQKLLMSALPDALDVAGEDLEDKFDVPQSIARLAAYLVFKKWLTTMPTGREAKQWPPDSHKPQ